MAQEKRGADPDLAAQIRKYQDILAKDPQNLAFARLGEAYRRANMLNEAILICQEGLKYHPNYTIARVTLARALYTKKEIHQAQIEFEKVIEETPDNVLSLRLLGEIYERNGDIDKAVPLYQHILELNPADDALRAKLERLAVEQIDPEDLLREAERIINGSEGSAVDVASPFPTIPQENEQIDNEAAGEVGDAPDVPEVEPEEIIEEVEEIGEESDRDKQDPPLTLKDALDMLELGGQESQEILGDLDLATETIADLYFQQGHLERALLIYERLLDKDPDEEEIKRKIDGVKSQLPRKRVAAIAQVYRAWRQEQVQTQAVSPEKIRGQIAKLEKWLSHIERNKL